MGDHNIKWIRGWRYSPYQLICGMNCPVNLKTFLDARICEQNIQCMRWWLTWGASWRTTLKKALDSCYKDVFCIYIYIYVCTYMVLFGFILLLCYFMICLQVVDHITSLQISTSAAFFGFSYPLSLARFLIESMEHHFTWVHGICCSEDL